MDEPKSLDSLFKDKIFRIPDYQRGFAWKKEQLIQFWEDLVNLPYNRSHYTGVLTLKQIPDYEILKNSKEYWLVEDQSFHVHHIVDGQQRLTTFIIFLQAFIELCLELTENRGKSKDTIFITESINLSSIEKRYLFKIKPTGDQYRSYLFGYEIDNPSYNYLRYSIFREDGAGYIDETFYTHNLYNAKLYFKEQLNKLYEDGGFFELQNIYKKLTRKFLFNEYIIKDEFDVFIAFETMNNRGKKLSDLELLKNRLIYLTTLYTDAELDLAERNSLRETINDAWKVVYHQLGRNKLHPLNDDDFLRAHWIMFYKYSRKTGKDYIKYLLESEFSPKNIHKKISEDVILDNPEEIRTEEDFVESDDDNDEVDENNGFEIKSELAPLEIRDYSLSLKESVVHWFSSFYPEIVSDLSEEEKKWISRLNRIGIGYFRPLIMSILKNERNTQSKLEAFKAIERFIFINFRLNFSMSNHGSSDFYNAARSFDRGEFSIQSIIQKLNERLSYSFNKDGSFQSRFFFNYLYKKFKSGAGYYGWPYLRYFLYEYESSLLTESRQQKVYWSDFLKSEKDKISIEHIYPQSASDEWVIPFANINLYQRKNYCGSLGNLLLLSMSINSSLQNDSFANKKNAKYNSNGEKIRNGYSDGCHSEIEVHLHDAWGPEQIQKRGLKLLRFLENRWDIRFSNDEEREKLLFLDFDEGN